MLTAKERRERRKNAIRRLAKGQTKAEVAARLRISTRTLDRICKADRECQASASS